MNEPKQGPITERQVGELEAPLRGGSLRDVKTLEDEVAEASDESFPASDPPAWTSSIAGGRARRPKPK